MLKFVSFFVSAPVFVTLSGMPIAFGATETFNLRAAPYNASGSIATARCTVIGGNNAITCPQGTADFKVGQSIVISRLGTLPDITPPLGLKVEAASTGGQPTAGADTVDVVDSIAEPPNTRASLETTAPSPNTVFMPETMAGISPGVELIIDSGASEEKIFVSAVTAKRFTAATHKQHSRTEGPIRIRGYAITLTPQSMANIFPGATLILGAGTNADVGTVVGITKTNFTITYGKAHKAPFMVNGKATYCYAAAAVQGTPNGAMTAATAPTCITQAIETPAAGSSVPFPGIYTKVAITPVSDHLRNRMGYAIWKRTNGGSWHLHSYESVTSVEDQGIGPMPQMPNFTYADFGLPDAPPSEPTRNDLYAMITSIDGKKMRLGPRTSVPRQIVSRTAFPWLPAVSMASAIVMHDDTPSLRALVDDLRSRAPATSKKVEFPCGDYNLWEEDPSGWLDVIDVIGLANVAFEGAGKCSFLHVRNARQIDGAFNNSQAGWFEYQPVKVAGAFGGRRFSELPMYLLADPALKGSNKIQLSDHQQATHIAPGDPVAIGVDCGAEKSVCHDPRAYPGGRYSETNFVTAVDAQTGIIGLRYPLNKTYSNVTNYTDPLCPLKGVACAGLPVIVDNNDMAANGGRGFVTAHHIEFRDLRIAVPFIFWASNSDYNITFENLTIDSYMLDTQGAERFVTWRNNRLTVEGADVGQGFSSGSNGSADLLYENNDITQNAGGQACSEGTVNVRYINNRITTRGFSTTANGTGNFILDGGAYCDQFLFAHNIIIVGISNAYAIFGRDDIGHVGIEVADNVLITTSFVTAPIYKGSLLKWTTAKDPNTSRWRNNAEIDLSNDTPWEISSDGKQPNKERSPDTDDFYAGERRISVDLGHDAQQQIRMVDIILTAKQQTPINLSPAMNKANLADTLFIFRIQQDTAGYRPTRWTNSLLGMRLNFCSGALPVPNPAPNSMTILAFQVNHQASAVNQVFCESH